MSLVDDAVIAPESVPAPSLEELLDFEASAPMAQLAKTRAIRETFGISLTRYVQLLIKTIDMQEAFTHSPVLVARLRRLRDERRALRFTSVRPEPAPRPDPRQRSLPSRPHREGATSMTQPEEADVGEEELTGEDYKQLGMNMADAFADKEWSERVDAAIAELARTHDAGGLLVTFTAEDVRRIAGDPPDHPNAMGARFSAAAHRKLISKVGYRMADRPSLHRHPIAVWQGHEVAA